MAIDAWTVILTAMCTGIGVSMGNGLFEISNDIAVRVIVELTAGEERTLPVVAHQDSVGVLAADLKRSGGDVLTPDIDARKRRFEFQIP